MDPQWLDVHLSSGGSPDATRGGATLLQCAIAAEDGGAVAKLLEAGADPRLTADGGEAPMLLALKCRAPDIARLLMTRVEIRECTQQTIWFAAALELSERRRSNVYRNLKRLGVDINTSDRALPNSPSNTLVPPWVHTATAARGSRFRMLSDMISHGATCGGISGGMSDLHHAVLEWVAPEVESDQTEDRDAALLARVAMEAGADPNRVDDDAGMSPLMEAVAAMAVTLTRALLRGGGNPNARRRGVPDWPVVFMAGPASAAGGDDAGFEMLQLLIEYGVDLASEVVIRGERTSLFDAAALHRLTTFVCVMIRHARRATPPAFRLPQDSLVTLALYDMATPMRDLLAEDANKILAGGGRQQLNSFLAARSFNGDSVFHVAAHGSHACLHALLDSPHAAERVTLQGGEYAGRGTVLHTMARNGWNPARRHAVRSVLASPHAGVMINAVRADTGTTALADASQVQNSELVRMLLESGADPDASDAATPLMCAVQHADDKAADAKATVAVLLEHGAEPNTDVLAGLLLTTPDGGAFAARMDMARLLLRAGATPPAQIFRRQGFASSAALTGEGPVFRAGDFSAEALACVVAACPAWKPHLHKHFCGRRRAVFRSAVKTLMLVLGRQQAAPRAGRLPALPAELFLHVVLFLA